jgi:hypothetical protein
MKIKLRLWAVMALVLIIAGFGSYKLLKPTPTTTVSSYNFVYDGAKQGETAFSVLKNYLDEKDILYTTKSYDFGMFVESINGKISGADMAWIYYVNGKSGNIASDKYMLKAGDKVEWKYEKPQF